MSIIDVERITHDEASAALKTCEMAEETVSTSFGEFKLYFIKSSIGIISIQDDKKIAESLVHSLQHATA